MPNRLLSICSIMYSFALLSLFPLALEAALSKRDYPPVGACLGDCSYVHDPSVIISSSGTYYRFVTFKNITIATAPSISGPWTTQKGAALPNGTSIKLPTIPTPSLWAPDVSELDGTYYLFYAASHGRPEAQNSDIGVATSTTLDSGSWTDHGSIGIANQTYYNRIDPNLLQSTNGDGSSSLLLAFGSYWHDIFQVPLTNPPLKTASNAPAVQLERNTSNVVVEGSYQFRWTASNDNNQNKTYYYLFFSSGACCNEPPNLVAPGDEYKIMVCRSESPSSGFVDQHGKPCAENGGTLVLGSHGNVYAPGGQGVLFDPALHCPVLYYHYGEFCASCCGDGDGLTEV